MPALRMMPSPSATLASATVCTYVLSCSSSCTRAFRLALRVAAAPLVRARAAASAVWKSLMAVVTVASAGAGDGNAALPVMVVTICCAFAARPATLVGSLSTATERCVWVDSLVMGNRPLSGLIHASHASPVPVISPPCASDRPIADRVITNASLVVPGAAVGLAPAAVPFRDHPSVQATEPQGRAAAPARGARAAVVVTTASVGVHEASP